MRKFEAILHESLLFSKIVQAESECEQVCAARYMSVCMRGALHSGVLNAVDSDNGGGVGGIELYALTNTISIIAGAPHVRQR